MTKPREEKPNINDIYLKHVSRILESEKHIVDPSVISNLARQVQTKGEGYEFVGKIDTLLYKGTPSYETIQKDAVNLAMQQDFTSEVRVIPEVFRNHNATIILELVCSNWRYNVYAKAKGTAEPQNKKDTKKLSSIIGTLIDYSHNS